MSASVTFKAIMEMLGKCAPGFTVRLANHSHVISYNGLVYRSLPKFDNIELGHVRKMARHLGILECAKAQGVA